MSRRLDSSEEYLHQCAYPASFIIDSKRCRPQSPIPDFLGSLGLVALATSCVPTWKLPTRVPGFKFFKPPLVGMGGMVVDGKDTCGAGAFDGREATFGVGVDAVGVVGMLGTPICLPIIVGSSSAGDAGFRASADSPLPTFLQLLVGSDSRLPA